MFRIKRGETFIADIHLIDVVNGEESPLPLANCTFLFQIRSGRNENTELLYEQDSEIEVVDEDNGDIKLTIPPEHTFEFRWKQGFADLFVFNQAEERRPAWLEPKSVTIAPTVIPLDP